ncbi:hypothetical protein SARC_07375 [Sphaeroforma arctica JP610]|uniref:Uncharacterized protein n=1 Tax=Sphaeroforma arctica JP610 TaxID=667725 RepID=A0A0L0FTU9_9EUKA|nr:hypothetical protein SARC_07375 [Sphaeroforma arctica JP610]KNC80265.1 hypothetical protein SARC_07375 [Sphaeroforma arctica JP610]|eukprot:XP_014154167.1 hypothetical protein SARC_07375 [Sphaeroforma arctica JP610]
MQYIEGRFRTLLNNKPERLTTHHIAARQKDDGRELWVTIADEAKAAVSKQQTLEGGTESAIAPSGSEASVKKQLSLTPEETESQLKLGMEAQTEVKECVAENAVGGN